MQDEGEKRSFVHLKLSDIAFGKMTLSINQNKQKHPEIRRLSLSFVPMAKPLK